MKKKFLALAMASAVMLTGAGYAYWTDSLQINSTVSTGELNVVFTNTNVGDWGDPYVDVAMSDVTDKSFNATISNLYPGKKAWVYAQEKNVGTIPATFDYATVDRSGSDRALEEVLEYNISYRVKDAEGAATPLVTVTGKDLANFEASLNEALANVRLEPGDTLEIGEVPNSENDALQSEFDFILPTTVDNAANVEKKEVKVDVTINWKQHNADKTVLPSAPVEEPTEESPEV